ncbi:MAG: PASTA domain-containing protein [Endomicrobium sp.]|jgi:serine/threonine-protein kinase|nr:PASTA domain-containing protein [Endomicrobium sp.]
MLKNFFKLLVVSTIIIVAFYFTFSIVIKALVHSKKEVVVPNISGKSLYDALEKLSENGFALKKDGEEFSQKVANGTILRQTPPAGMIVREGRIIKVTVSKGREIVLMPNLIGQTLRSSDITLKNLGLVIGKVYQKYSISHEKGVVFFQDIEADKVVAKNSVVNIEVSKGPPPKGIVLMPNFVNKNLEEAQMWATQNGIAINVLRIGEKPFDYETNTIVKQYPESNTDITDAGNVSLYISD